MIFNGGPSGNASSSGTDFNFGGKFNLETDIQISFDDETYQNLNFYSNETTAEKEYYELRYQNEEDPDTNKWYIKFLDNCYIQLSKKLKCEIFMVGQGQTGTSSSFSGGNDSGSGGNGGNGGKIKQYNNEEIAKNKYQILIQQNNVEIKTNQELIYTSDIGEVIGLGGIGASITSGYSNIYDNGNTSSIPGNLSSPGGDGQKKYNIYYGAGGGGGLAHANYINGGSDPNWSYDSFNRSASLGGGKNGDNDYSGGHGGGYNSSGGEGKLNTGSGGGGGGGGHSEAYSKPGGAGSYGTIIISNL